MSSTKSRCRWTIRSARFRTCWQRRISATSPAASTPASTWIRSQTYAVGSTTRQSLAATRLVIRVRSDGYGQAARKGGRGYWRQHGNRFRHCEALRRRRRLCLHNGPPPKGARRGGEGDRQQCRRRSGGDVSKLQALDRLYETVKAKGKIDVLVANAGTGEFAPLASLTEEPFDKLF